MITNLLLILLGLLCAILALAVYKKDKKLEKARKQFLGYLEKLDKENSHLKRLVARKDLNTRNPTKTYSPNQFSFDS